VPQLLRKTVTDVTWTSVQTAEGIQDNWQINMPTEVAKIFNETMSPTTFGDNFNRSLVSNRSTITFYDLKNAQTAWRSLILVAQEQGDSKLSSILGELSTVLVEPYGIRDAERFLSTAKSTIVTAKCGSDDDRPIVMMVASDLSAVKSALDPDLKLQKSWSDLRGGELWASSDDDVAAYVDSSIVVAGEFGCVEAISKKAHLSQDSLPINSIGEPPRTVAAAVTTAGHDAETAKPVVEMLSEVKPDIGTPSWSYKTETHFNKTGMERRTVSDLGLIGSIIAQLNGG
jgi:hypothetical protein